MIYRQTIEMTLLHIACQNGELLDHHTLYTIRTSVAQALQTKERRRQKITSPDYQLKKPAGKR